MKKVLVANRGEIAIRVFRAIHELGMESVGIYAKEDEHSLHRYKADEAYLVGTGKKPTEAYLDMDHIIEIALASGADAIHPGYGFLSENIEFAKKCIAAGLTFIGPSLTHLDMLGDKVKAKEAAHAAGLKSIPGTQGTVSSVEEVYSFGEIYGYPIMIKAALGGGGRGMRVVHSQAEVADSYERAVGEAIKAFGAGECYVEKYIQNPQHIEVQILGDQFGQVVHLYERDCSVQRRHQKVIEVAPCVSLSEDMRTKICTAAADFMRKIGYVNAGTVEFLYDGTEFYFIEVNPRIQVEHTITELITGVDIVQAQLLIAEGKDLHKEIGIPKQEDLRLSGAAIQCRITTEDPENHFLPDTGKINTYRSPGGFGIRLDAGNAFQGNVVTPYFDSLLVKVCTFATSFDKAVIIMQRALNEFSIRGVKTNIPFLKNVIHHPIFQAGAAKTTFIDTEPNLFVFKKDHNRGNKTLQYISEITVNGYPGIKKHPKPIERLLKRPVFEKVEDQKQTAKQVLDQMGARYLSQWILGQEDILLTDTTFRDAHQSLMATRMRTQDLVRAADLYEEALPQLFSAEVWGGATFDTAFRFLTEDPWQRLAMIRASMPNTLLQMLLRGSNAVGYSKYPDNVIQEFIKEAARTGVDVFRIFDSLNWLPQMEVSIQAVRDAGKVAEVAMCYTGDLLNPNRSKYSLDYYVQLAKDIEASGAHILAIKDMAGLLKPKAAHTLISHLKDEITIPIHLHTHDTSGNGLYTLGAAIEAGVDIVDVAMSSFSGGTSQPSMESLLYSLDMTGRSCTVDVENANKINNYWQSIRHYYKDFDQADVTPAPEVYVHEMPGGQYTNLKQQAISVGLGDRWDEIKQMYHKVNLLFGDIIKVTPSSKVVGDMTLFMIQNHLDESNIYEKAGTLDFPESVISFFRGDLGQPYGGFPKELQALVLKGERPLTDRPGAYLDPVNFEDIQKEVTQMMGEEASNQDVLSYLMYPKVFQDFIHKKEEFGEVHLLDTPTFFNGMRTGETIEVTYAPGKVMTITLVQIGEPNVDGERIMFFKFNGQSREIIVRDRSIQTKTIERSKADPKNTNHIGATMPGTVLKVLVSIGETIEKGQPLIVTEAMKMETTLQASQKAVVKTIAVADGEQIAVGDLLIELETE